MMLRGLLFMLALTGIAAVLILALMAQGTMWALPIAFGAALLGFLAVMLDD